MPAAQSNIPLVWNGSDDACGDLLANHTLGSASVRANCSDNSSTHSVKANPRERISLNNWCEIQFMLSNML
jgi:hypothetical protein